MSYARSFCVIIIRSVQLKHASRQGEHEAVCMVFSVVYVRRGASAGGFLWKAPGCENRASQSGPRGCVNNGSSRASLHWTGPLQTETMSQPQEHIHVPPLGIISQTQPGKCERYRADVRGRIRACTTIGVIYSGGDLKMCRTWRRSQPHIIHKHTHKQAPIPHCCNSTLNT